MGNVDFKAEKMVDYVNIINSEKLCNCPVCKSDRIETFLNGYDYETDSGAYNVDICNECKLKFTNPKPLLSEIPKLYADRATPDFVRSTPLIDKLRAFSVQRFLKTLPVNILSGSKLVLDYGCGDGFFINEVKKFNPSLQLVATDFHEASPDILKSQLTINYLSNEKIVKDKNTYEVIICRHVLEHSYDPVEKLSLFYSLLKPGGYLIIEVPNSESVWARVFGKFYSGYYLPRHLFHYNSSSLCLLLKSYTEVSITLDNTPLIGRSLGYKLGINIQNTGLIGLALFPIQVIFDRIYRSSSVLQAISKKPSYSARH